MDIKHPDAEKHKKLIGVDNRLILENIGRADASPHNFGIVVRTPLVPGINDADEDIAKLAGIVKRLKKLRFMEFLAYHRLGTETYKRLEIPYPLKEIQTPGREYMERKARRFNELSQVHVRINGIEL